MLTNRSGDSGAPRALRMPPHSDSTHSQGGPEQGLPKGWSRFRSRGDSGNPDRWYATAPFTFDAMERRYGRAANAIACTVSGESLAQLFEAAWVVQRHADHLGGTDAD